MIVRDKPSVWELMTALRGSVVPQILRPVLFLVAFALALVALGGYLEQSQKALNQLQQQMLEAFGVKR